MAVKFKISFKGEDLGVFDSDEVTMDQAIQLEDQAKMTLMEVINGTNRTSAKAMQAMVWFRYLQLGRPQPLHTDFKFGDLVTELVEDEADDADPTPAADPVAALEEAFKKPATSGSAR